jgi:hypothetical protein
VSAGRLAIQGAAELAAAFRALPADLQGEGRQLVVAAANGAATAIRTAYGAHRRTGNLQDHVVVTELVSEVGGVLARVRSTARHATMFERGTAARHTTVHRTRSSPPGRGGYRGKMPAASIFIPRAIEARRAMQAALVALVRRFGLTVTGDGA